MASVADMYFGDSPGSLNIVKPWWDVFTELLTVLMIILSILTITMQMSSASRMHCIPVPNGFNMKTLEWNKTIVDELVHQKLRIRIFLDWQQYVKIDQWCYDTATLWYSKYFPYMVFIHAMIFMACANFWFKFPGTSSKIEHFVAILFKCLDSEWTTRALAQAIKRQKEEEQIKVAADAQCKLTNDTPTSSVPLPVVRKTSNFKRFNAVEPIPLEKSVSKTSTAKAGGNVESQTVAILDKREAEQAKGLFEKVKKLRLHTEGGDILSTMYIRQTILRFIQTLCILSYVAIFTPKMQYIIHCVVETKSTGCSNFFCIHGLQNMFTIYSYCCFAIIILYCCTCLYTLYWILFYRLKEYSFETVRRETKIDDIPDVKNDFAFLLHLIDQYDSLYAQNFAIFLSGMSENQLLQLNLDYQWTKEKLMQRLTVNANNKNEMHLYMMPAIPSMLYELSNIEVLKMELVTKANIQDSISNLVQLKEMWILSSCVTVEAEALHFLEENLNVLHIRFKNTKEIPSWIFALKNLSELYMEGNLPLDTKPVSIRQSLQKLVNLKCLSLRSNFTKVPAIVADVANPLQRLVIDNQKIKLSSIAIIKKLHALTQLKLIQCGLDRIPNVLFSLKNLQKLDLRENCLTSINEVVSFQNLKKFSSLKIQSNKITNISPSIAKVTTLEFLNLSKNQITDMPTSLCKLYKLKNLALSYNFISVIPKEISCLEDLQVFTIEQNKISELPEELFQCTNLRVLILASNSIKKIPPAIGKLLHLRHLNLSNNKLEGLPVELGSCQKLKKNQFIVEEIIYNTLPQDIREQFENNSEA